MLILFIIYIIVCLYGVKLNFSKDITPKYISVEYTQSIKGIFILLVFFSHFNSYVTFDTRADLIYKGIVLRFGQTMVTMFLFYSGYGIMEQIKRKGMGYINAIPRKRLFSTLFKFDCAVCLFLLLNILLKEDLRIGQVLLSFTGWDTIGNSNWYIFVILVLYLITYIAFKVFFRKNVYLSVALCGGLIGVMVIGCHLFKIKPLYWYDTAFCYFLGILFSVMRDRIEKLINTHKVIWWVCIVLSFLTAIFLRILSDSVLTVFAFNMLFAIIVVLLTMRITLHNRILAYCGENLFEIYILQRIPMIVFSKVGLADFSIVLYFICCAVSTFILMIPFRKVTDMALASIGKWQKAKDA